MYAHTYSIYRASRRMAVALLGGLAVVVMGACSDALYEDFLETPDGETDDELRFSVSTVEQTQLLAAPGATRAAGSALADSTRRSAFVRSMAFRSRPFEASPVADLQVHRLPMPAVEGHPRTASAPQADTAATATRAPLSEMVTADGRHFHDSLTIWGYIDDVYKTTGTSDAANKTIFNQVLLQRIRNWRSSAHWPYGGGKMRFYAVSPAMESMDLLVEGSDKKEISFANPPTLTYTLPETAGEMRDLVYGQSEEIVVCKGPTGLSSSDAEAKQDNLGQDNKQVALSFKHLLTAVRFVQGTIPKNMTIKTITIEGVPVKGTYSAATDSWAVDPGTPTGTYSIATRHVGSGVTNVFIDNDQVFFFIPCTLEASAKLKVELDVVTKVGEADVTTPHTVECSLKDDVWKEGCSVIYRITIGELQGKYVLLADQPAAHEHSASAINGSFRLQSYREFTDYSSGLPVEDDRIHEAHPVDWKVVGYSTDKGDEKVYSEGEEGKPDWLVEGPHVGSAISGAYAGGAKTVSYSISAQKIADSKTVPGHFAKHTHRGVLGANKEKYGTGINLANYTPNDDSFSCTPANCYIVNRKGDYGFPLIYGYAADSKKDPTFVDHMGLPITSEWISDQLMDEEHSETIYKDADGNVITTGTKDERRAAATTWEVHCYNFDSTLAYDLLRAELVWQDVLLVDDDEKDEDKYKNQILITHWEGMADGKPVNYNDPRLSLGLKDFDTPSSKPTFDWEKATFSGDNMQGMIQFRIQNARPGNAVIALKGRRLIYKKTRSDVNDPWPEDKDIALEAEPESEFKTIWTWHIWMTDEVYANDNSTNVDGVEEEIYDDEDYLYTGKTNKGKRHHVPTLYYNASGGKTRILPVNLGWVPDADDFGYYDHREVWVKLQQTEGDAEPVVVKLEQHARQPLVTGTSTIYQWGRPTPFPMVRRMDGTKRKIFDIDGKDITDEFTIGRFTHIQDFVLNPKVVGRANDGESRYSWWDMDSYAETHGGKQPSFWFNEKDGTKKTVYDPCPPGFRLPQGNMFSGFSLTGKDENSGANLNIWPDALDDSETMQHSAERGKGGYFYTEYQAAKDPEKRYSDMLYMPAQGFWSNNQTTGATVSGKAATMHQATDEGRYWLGEAPVGKMGLHLRFVPQKAATENAIKLEAETEFGRLLPVRPVVMDKLLGIE